MGGRTRKERTGPAAKRAMRAEKQERDAFAQTELVKFTKAAQAVRRGDAFANAITGLGIAGLDWRRSTAFAREGVLQRQQIDDIYAADNLAAKIVDAPAMHAVRRWIRLSGGAGEDISTFQTEIFMELTRLGAKQRFQEWLRLGRKDGGCIMLIGVNDGKQIRSPLNMAGIREIRNLHVIERHAVLPDAIDLNPLSDSFGEPEWYRLLPRPLQISNSGLSNAAIASNAKLDNLPIHSSRVFAHKGIQVSERRRVGELNWGYSALQRAWGSIENYRVLWGHIATVFKHVSQTFVKLGGFADLQGNDFQNALNARLTQIQMMRSTMRVVALDIGDEVVEQTLQGISGALEIFKYAQEDLAQAADMPLTMLFGHTPEGFSSDDVAGTRNFYDSIHVLQEEYLLGPLTKLVKMLAVANQIKEPEQWRVEFLPLMEPTEQERATKRNMDALTDAALITAGIIDPEEARETLRATGAYIMTDGPAKGDPVVHPELKQVAASAGPPNATNKPIPANQHT